MILLLSAVIIVMLGVRMLLPVIDSSEPAVEPMNNEEIDAFIKKLETRSSKTKKETKVVECLPVVNPNSATSEQWRQLGLNQKQIQNIHNYLEKVGDFQKVSDVKKIYAINEQQYRKLRPYMKIPTPESDISNGESNVKKDAREPFYTESDTLQDPPALDAIELNRADAKSLRQINGIGTVFSGRIIKYRDLLGGYVKLEQLKEVYGIDQERYQKIRSYLTVNAELVQKIDLNHTTFKELIRHPYLNKHEVVKILDYLEYADNRIQTTEALLENKILDNNTYAKMKGYLKVQNE